jgi:hypothetical protein
MNINKRFALISEPKVINSIHNSARRAICTATGAHPSSFKQLQALAEYYSNKQQYQSAHGT